MSKENLSRRTLIASAGIASLAACGKRVEDPKPLPKVVTGINRFNIIFHGVMVFWDNGGNLTVYLPKSNETPTSPPVHQYKIGWTTSSGPVEHILPDKSTEAPTEWRDLPTGEKPDPSKQDFLVFPKDQELKPANTHIAFTLPYPDAVLTFRYTVAPVRIFDGSLPLNARNPVRLAFPIVFTYREPAAGKHIEIPVVAGPPISVPIHNGGDPFNLHVYAAPEKGHCPTTPHLFVNNQALEYKKRPLNLVYKDPLLFQSSPIYASDPTFDLIGLDASDLTETCDTKQKVTIEDSKGLAQTARWKTLPPDSCFGMWVID